ncbi:MAG: glycosyltransferase family 39 protein, partial [Chloroflexi bacterium]|nr:glycosyltransferase family 39 protein [Chloroflexota bacterium]
MKPSKAGDLSKAGQTGAGHSSHIPLALVTLATVLAFFFRTNGVASLTLWGDSAYSVYTATQDLVSIASGRVYDGHPPLYYYLLHFWIALTGTSELSLRMLSIFLGVLAVPATFKLTQVQLRKFPLDYRRQIGHVGIVAACLVAFSPMLTYYSRLVRMYSLFPLLTLLSAYALLASLKKGQLRLWIAYVALTTAALYTHYYALAVVASEAVYVLAFHRRERRARVSWAASQLAIGFL